MSALRQFLRSNKGLTFAALLITLGLGIAIGTVVSDGVFSAGEREQVAELKIQGPGSPQVLDQHANLADGFARVATTVGPTVVNISTTAVIKQRSSRSRRQPDPEPFEDFFGQDFFDRFFGPAPPGERRVSSLGSGVIVDSKGYILTNDHVVSAADKINVKLSSGETYIARVVGEDRENDLAVLKIDVPKPLPFAKVGDTSSVHVGDWVVAIGSPFGLEQTVTAGIVSATGRIGFSSGSGRGIIPFTEGFGDYIQTDAAINPGNSGGALVNTRGEVVGINTFISTKSGGSEGVGFAIPSGVFVNSYNQLVTKGKIERGWLGVSMNVYDMTEELAQYFGVAGTDPQGVKDGDGVLVTQLIDEKGDPAETGPAYKAGIRPEDVIVKFGGREIETIYDLRSAVANTPPGQTVPVLVVRKGEVKRLNVTLAERTLEDRDRRGNGDDSLSFDEKEEQEKPKEIGLEFETLSQQDAAKLGLESSRGVRIISVAPGSLADEAGLEADQVITHVNGTPVSRSQEFYDRIRSMPSGKGVVLRVVTVSADQRQNRQTSISYTSFVKP
ncbi:MAG: trypsin-like peptidase domain-containing protein [Acidobacteriota bacterium]